MNQLKFIYIIERVYMSGMVFENMRVCLNLESLV